MMRNARNESTNVYIERQEEKNGGCSSWSSGVSGGLGFKVERLGLKVES